MGFAFTPLGGARLKQRGLAARASAAQACLLATLSNLAFKSGVALFVGGRPLAARVLPAFAVIGALTGVLLFI